MKSDINGYSTCPKGHEQYEFFSRKDKDYVQYDYRTEDGKLFSCITKTLEEARLKKDEWLKNPY